MSIENPGFQFKQIDADIQVPQAGDVWYFTGPILGQGYLFDDWCMQADGSRKKELFVRFRAGGEYGLDECWPSELLWRDA